MFKLDKKNNKLLFTQGDQDSLFVNLFRGYTRHFGGMIQDYETSKKYLFDEMNKRKWFLKLNSDQQEKFVFYIMQQHSKGFSNE
jgi:hypothetical protein